MTLDLVVSLVGIVLVIVVLHDFVHTTLTLQGGGILANFVMTATWRILLFIHHRLPQRGLLQRAGVVSLLTTILAWTTLLWLGWLLFFLPHQDSVHLNSNGSSASFWSRAYFVGYSLATLGIGDYVPNGAIFQVATVLAALSGFFLMTLSVTYLIPVVSAVVEKRQLAAQIFLGGRTPQEMVENALQSSSRDAFVQDTRALAIPLLLLSERLYAYPVLRLFPSPQRETAITVGVVVLDEALTLLLLGIRDDENPISASQLSPVRKAVDMYMESRLGAGEAASVAPPPPPLDALRKAGAPTVSEDEFERRVEGIAKRRKRLLALLMHDERTWSEVWNPVSQSR